MNIDPDPRKPDRPKTWEWRAPLILFFAAVCLKTIWALRAPGPYYFYDEFAYKNNADAFFNDTAIYSPICPCLYPLLIALAHFAGGHWYAAMLAINALVSSTLVFPVWLIARRLLPGRYAAAAAALSLLTAYHSIYPRLILSENAYLPLFMMAAWAVLFAPKDRWRNAVLTGALAALAYLTRYLGFAAIPIFGLLYQLRPPESSRPMARREKFLFHVSAFSGLLLGFLAVFLIWQGCYYALRGEFWLHPGPPRGTGALAHLAAGSLPLTSWFVWASLYAAYFILGNAALLTPPLAVLILGFRRRLALSAAEKRLLALAGLCAPAFIALATWHSATSAYNNPVPLYLIGRYLMHLTPLMIVLGLAGLYKLDRASVHWKERAVAIGVSGAGLILAALLARKILYGGAWFTLSPGFAAAPFNVPDTLLFLSGPAFEVLIAILATCVGLFCVQPLVSARFRKPIPALIVALLAVLGVAHLVNGAWIIESGQAIARPGKMLAQYFESQTKGELDRFTIVLDSGTFNPRNPAFAALTPSFLQLTFQFWGFDKDDFIIISSDDLDKTWVQSAPAKSYVLSKPTATGHGPLWEYRAGGDRLALYHFADVRSLNANSSATLKQPRDAAATTARAKGTAFSIQSWGPRMTKAGSSFNIQSDGRSALWFVPNRVSRKIVVMLEGKELPSQAGESLITASLEPGRLAKPGDYHLKLLDKEDLQESNEVIFRVNGPGHSGP